MAGEGDGDGAGRQRGKREQATTAGEGVMWWSGNDDGELVSLPKQAECHPASRCGSAAHAVPGDPQGRVCVRHHDETKEGNAKVDYVVLKNKSMTRDGRYEI